MGVNIDVQRLDRFEIAADGAAITLVVHDVAGRTAHLLFPVRCLSSLLMTLPKMLASAVQNRLTPSGIDTLALCQKFPGKNRSVSPGRPDVASSATYRNTQTRTARQESSHA